MKTKIKMIIVLIAFNFQLQAQNLITGSTTRGTEISTEIPETNFKLSEFFKFEFDKLYAGPVTLNGNNNSIIFDIKGVKAEMGFDGFKSIEADLQFISVGLEEENGHNYAIVKTTLGIYDLYFRVGKPIGMNTMTSAMALQHLPEMPYNLGIVNTTNGKKHSLDGKTKVVYRNMNSIEAINTSNYGNLLFSENFKSSKLKRNKWKITKNKGNVSYTIENNILKLIANGSRDHWITIESLQAFNYPLILEYSIAVPGNRNWLRSGFSEGAPSISSGKENHDSRFAYYNGTKKAFINATDANFHDIQIIWYSEKKAEFRDKTNGNNVILQSSNKLNENDKKLFFTAGDIYSKNNQMWIKNIKVYELK